MSSSQYTDFWLTGNDKKLIPVRQPFQRRRQMTTIKDLLVVPEKMDEEERRLQPICVASVRIMRWEHDGDSCCGLNAAYSAAEESVEEQEWTLTVPYALRVVDGSSNRVRPDLIDADGMLRNVEETAELFASWEEGIGHRCYEKGRCGKCRVTDKFEVLRIRVA